MSIKFIHLSDLHYIEGRAENHGVVLNTLFQDIGRQLPANAGDRHFLVLSGDIAQSGDDVAQYRSLAQRLDGELNRLGIPKSQRICVPGNHDASRRRLVARQVDHEGVVSQHLDEQRFNDYVAEPSNVLTEKFDSYKTFESQFADFGACASSVTGSGWDIGEGVGVYCLNTALCSSAGVLGVNGSPIDDRGRLAVDTRGLHTWIRDSTVRWRILVMHHPLTWLCGWAEKELRVLLRKHFTLCLSGHAHDQSSFHSLSEGVGLTECSAPPLFTRKSDELGYAIVSVDPRFGVTDITYRQWTKHQSFVSGVNFSNTDDGRVRIAGSEASAAHGSGATADTDAVDLYLSERLEASLVSFSSQPRVWVDPVLSVEPEIARDAESKPKTNLAEFVAAPKSSIIKAPPLFGLTCLAHHLVREAWRSSNRSTWLYLDSKQLKPHAASIDGAVQNELLTLLARIEDVKCVVLDSLTYQDKDSAKILQKVSERFPGVPIVGMRTVDDTKFLANSIEEYSNHIFDVLYLWSLPRSHVRKMVADYNEARAVGEEDVVTSRIVSDLEVMNIHRTPLNCLTLLKVSEIDFDESPVNRTEMIKRVLFLLFNIDDIPTYKSRPDLKDCEYVLGYFCETMLKEDDFVFSRDKFLRVLEMCCKERLIELEVEVVFDVLYANNIVVRSGNLFCFRFRYWIFYFAAQRMHHSPDFAKFIYSEMHYVRYPEIIEFYTGIDRRRDDALHVLANDIRTTCDAVEAKCGLPPNLNVFGLAQWQSSPAMLAQMENEMRNGVENSNLPAAIKDQYADRGYDRARPYDQGIHDILSEHSLVQMLQAMKAGARALRNSDYVDPQTKRALLHELLRCWEQVSMVLLVLLPVLAERGDAVFGGARVLLVGEWGDTVDTKLRRILVEIPVNVVSLFQEDLFSQKMGPLLIDQCRTEKNDLRRHELVLLLIMQRPRGWRGEVHRYIASVKKNSFYLYDVYHGLRAQYRYGYASPQTLRDLEYLIKMAIAKHVTGDKEPGAKAIKRITEQLADGTDIVPRREV